MAKKKSRKQNEITEQPGNSELEVLKVLWQHGSSSVRQIAEHLKELELVWADTTIHTLLSRLRKKQLVDANKKDGTLQFHALVDQQQLAEQQVDQILDRFGTVTTMPIVKALIKNQSLSEAEIEELHELVDSFTKPNKNKKRGK